MKFAILALLAATVVGGGTPCTSTMHVEFYKDTACTKKNKKMTKEQGTPPPDALAMFDGKCHAMPEQPMSMKANCDDGKFTMKVFNGTVCGYENRIEKMEIPFNECVEEGPGGGSLILFK